MKLTNQSNAFKCINSIAKEEWDGCKSSNEFNSMFGVYWFENGRQWFEIGLRIALIAILSPMDFHT